MRPIHSLCRPTSEMRMSSRPSAWRISHSARGGCIGKCVVVLRGLEAPQHHLAQARGAARVRHVAALLRQPREHVVDVADQLDLGDEVLVDLGRHASRCRRSSCRARGSSARASARPGRSRSRAPRRRRRSRPSSSRPTGGRPSRAPCGSSAGSRPLPMNVSATGMPVARTNSRSAGVAPPRITPLPASATGLSAPRIRSAAFSSSRAWGSGCDGLAARQRRRVDLRRHHVLGQLDVGRAGLLGLGHLERLAHDLGDDVRVVEARVPLRDRPHHPHEVDVLVRLLVHPLEVALAGERHQRRAVEVGVGHRGHEVQRARARACRGRRRRGRSAGRRRRPCRRRPARGGRARSRSRTSTATR